MNSFLTYLGIILFLIYAVCKLFLNTSQFIEANKNNKSGHSKAFNKAFDRIVFFLLIGAALCAILTIWF